MTTPLIKSVKAVPATPPLSSFSGWWRRTAELEGAMDYAGSSEIARQAWDDTVARLMLEPSEALYAELSLCLRLWEQVSRSFVQFGETFLDALVVAAFSAGLTLSDYPALSVSKLRQMLEAHRRYATRRR
jgi:hypothetical protein